MRLLLTQRGAPTEGVILDIAHTLSTCGSWGLRSWVDMMCSGRPLSRVLFEAKRFATVIHLACLLPNTSSDIPEGLEAGHLSGLGRHPLFVLLRVGFTMRASSPKRRCALTAPFHRDRCSEEPNGRLLSVALSRGLPLVAVSDHLALWSPDFPPILMDRRPRGRPERAENTAHAPPPQEEKGSRRYAAQGWRFRRRSWRRHAGCALCRFGRWPLAVGRWQTAMIPNVWTNG